MATYDENVLADTLRSIHLITQGNPWLDMARWLIHDSEMDTDRLIVKAHVEASIKSDLRGEVERARASEARALSELRRINADVNDEVEKRVAKRVKLLDSKQEGLLRNADQIVHRLAPLIENYLDERGYVPWESPTQPSSQ